MKEIRSYGQLTNNAETRKVEGYASLFNSRSVDLGGFTEEIAIGAFDNVIEKSTVLALMNHNEDRGILAKSVKGKGSLKLDVDERGLHFEFEAPNTPLGDELLEMIKRSDINTCSFAFKVESDSWTKNEDGTYLRTINKIGKLFDISPVYAAAYPETSIEMAKRSLDAFKAEEEKRAEEEKEEEKEEDVKEEKDEVKADDEKKEDVEKEEEVKADDEKNEDSSQDDEKKEDVEEKEEEEEEEKEEDSSQEDKHDKRNCINTMEKFSLVKTIRSIVNNQAIEDVNQAILDLGKDEMRKSGLFYSGQIQLPFETRSTPDAVQATVTGAGQEIVETEKLNILEPLKNRLVFTELGANYMTGLVGNISIPTYTGSTAGWAGEIDDAPNGAGNFGTVEYSPKRITAYIDISKQFINQDSVGAEALLRKDIVDAVAQVLESTVLGDAEGSTTKPAGIFNGATAEDITFANLVAAEEKLEEANIPGEYKFVVSPAIKAAMKQTTIGGTKSDLRMLLEDGEANGHPVVSTGNSKGIALANWADLLICQFGALDVTVDPYTVATKGCVRLVVNAYFDAKFRRSNSVVANIKTA